ncbi:MAG: FAD-dependent oxidoreductase, partial [Gaiellaceae bacterium]
MAHTSRSRTADGLRVLIAGGGVAGLEALLALRALAGDLVELELLAPEPTFFYRPLAVAEPFGAGQVARFELSTICDRIGASFTLDHLTAVELDHHRARSAHGAEIPYDVLLVAVGASPRPTVDGALTFRGPADVEQMRALLAHAVPERTARLCFAVGNGTAWTLPLYELALLSQAELSARGVTHELTVVTTERQPLEHFGSHVSAAVSDLLAERGIALLSNRRPARFAQGCLEMAEGMLPCDTVIATARLEGQRIYGLPQDDDGFLATDA